MRPDTVGTHLPCWMGLENIQLFNAARLKENMDDQRIFRFEKQAAVKQQYQSFDSN